MTIAFRPAFPAAAAAADPVEALPRLHWLQRGFARGERLPHDAGIHVVQEGLVALRKRGNAGPVLLSLAGPGCVVAGQDPGVEAEALTEVAALFLPEATAARLIGRDEPFTQWYIAHLSRQLSRARSRIYQLTALPARARLAWFLLEQHHAWDGDGYAIRLPLNRRELAAALGIRPETLARLIKAFEEDGVASFRGPDVRVASLAALEAEVGRRWRSGP